MNAKQLALSRLEAQRIAINTRDGIVYAVVDGDYDGEYFCSFTWYLNSAGYVVRHGLMRLDGHTNPIYLHHIVMSARLGYERDHINRNKLDNRSCNLRYVTHKENCWNRTRLRSTNKTGYVGVSQPCITRRLKDGTSKRYVYPRYRAVYSTKSLGYFDTPKEAALAYDKAAFSERGAFAILNFP